MHLHELVSTCSGTGPFLSKSLVIQIHKEAGFPVRNTFWLYNGCLSLEEYRIIPHVMNHFPSLSLVDKNIATQLVQYIINLSVEYGIFSNGDPYIKQYKDNSTYFLSDLDKVFDFTLQESKLLFKARRSRKKNMNIRFKQSLYSDNSKSCIRFDIHVPTYNKSFVISLLKIDDLHYLSVPKYAESVQHPDNDLLPIDFENLNDTLWAVVDSRYRYRVYYSNLKKELIKYYGKDVSLDNINISEAMAVIDAMEY